RYISFESNAVNKKGEVIPAPQTSDVEPPVFRVMAKEKTVIYEFRVPLAGRDAHPAGIGAQPGSTIKVGFEWGGMTKEMREAMLAKLGAEGTAAMATDVSMEESIGGGREDEGMRSGSSLDRMRRSGPKKYDFWIDVKLAQGETP
ncbi:MAG: hypothetical protein AB1715_12855, partial [Acidobacteriota bacterium]